MLTHLAADVGENLVPVAEFHAEEGVGQCFHHRALDLDDPILLGHVLRNPLTMVPYFRAFSYGTCSFLRLAQAASLCVDGEPARDASHAYLSQPRGMRNLWLEEGRAWATQYGPPERGNPPAQARRSDPKSIMPGNQQEPLEGGRRSTGTSPGTGSTLGTHPTTCGGSSHRFASGQDHPDRPGSWTFTPSISRDLSRMATQTTTPMPQARRHPPGVSLSAAYGLVRAGRGGGRRFDRCPAGWGGRRDQKKLDRWSWRPE